jgi:predicted transcriptional regulator
MGGAMPARSKLTPVEWEIMEAVWELGGSPSVREVLERAFPTGGKAYTTVQTIMNTLEKKGMLRRKKKGLVNFYTPMRSREDMVKKEMKGIVSRIFDGSVPALANYLIRSGGLSAEEIGDIKKQLDSRARELKRKKT